MPSSAVTIAPNHLDFPLGAQKMFDLSFAITCVLDAIMYYISHLILPEKGDAKVEQGLRFELLADKATRRIDRWSMAVRGGEAGPRT
jgi:hypothetical protein